MIIAACPPSLRLTFTAAFRLIDFHRHRPCPRLIIFIDALCRLMIFALIS